jgi:hypothetical protein
MALTSTPAGCGVYVDGVNIGEVGLHTLRRNITIIPQVSWGPVAWSSQKRGTEYVSQYGINWMNGSIERQCDRALR